MHPVREHLCTLSTSGTIALERRGDRCDARRPPVGVHPRIGAHLAGRTLGESKMSIAEATGFLRQLISLYRDTLAAL